MLSRSVAVCLLALGLPAHARGQQFDAASIRPSPPDPVRGYTAACQGGPGTNDPALFRCENMSLTNLLSRAYDVTYLQVAGPEWLKSTMFAVSVKVPPGTSEKQFEAMLRNLLIERFKLRSHRESREVAQYDLVVAKGGPKFKEATPAEAVAAEPAPAIAMRNGSGRLYVHSWNMETLAGFLSGQIDRPVTDATHLTSEYEISLFWAQASASDSIDSGPTIMRAVQDQLGLRLESKKSLVEFLVVDGVEKRPTEN